MSVEEAAVTAEVEDVMSLGVYAWTATTLERGREGKRGIRRNGRVGC
jgi:hypothetical protein